MSHKPFDISALLRSDLPPAAVKWSGYPKYNFVGGHNDSDSTPVEGLTAAATRVLKRDGRQLALYGMESGPLGYRPLREFVAGKLAKDAGIQCSPDEVLITSGSLLGLDFVNAALLERGDTVIIEQMTYGGAITRLNRVGANIIGVPVDHDGLSSVALRATLEDLRGKGIRPKYIYTIPTVQNPTATIMSEGRRAELVALSAEYGVPIFEDECYSDLVWDGKRPAAIYAMDKEDRVVHVGSFSKSIAPALRVGYLVARWPLMSRILGIKNDGGSGAIDQMVLAEYCRESFDSHVVVLRKALRRKVEVLMDALRHEFGTLVEFDDPVGGIFLWVKFPEGVDTTRLTQAALQASVAINPGAEWMTDATIGRRWVRICFAHPPEAVIREGIAKLAEVCQREFRVPHAPARIQGAAG
jgi:2-aminoadipate transaminase